MTRLPQIALLADGRRLHLQDGPIDLIVEADGSRDSIRAAYEAAASRFTGLLDALCAELTELRKPADPARCRLEGVVARRMHAAVAPFAAEEFITPMAAVAGSVAEEILGAMLGAAELTRAYANNGGDIALHLADGERFTVGLMDRPDGQGALQTMTVNASDPVRGIATSGWHGRSFSLGIADAVTVLARTASQADAAATVIANAVDLPGHPAVIRYPANELQADSDLGSRLVTREVGELSPPEVDRALEAGAVRAREVLKSGLIEGAALRLKGETVLVGARALATRPSQVHERMLEHVGSRLSCSRNGGALPLPLWERVGVRGRDLSIERNPSPGSHLSMRHSRSVASAPLFNGRQGGLCLSHKGRGDADDAATADPFHHLQRTHRS